MRNRVFAMFLAVVMVLAMGTTSVIADSTNTTYEEKLEANTELMESFENLKAESVGAPYYSSYLWRTEIEDAEKIAEEVAGHVTDDYEKARLFNKWISQHGVYDVFAEVGVDDPISAETGYRGICGNFAQTFNQLCWSQNIPCAVVVGFAGQKHAWNIFYANGEWHWADPTWDLGGRSKYFGISTEELSKSHIGMEPQNVLKASDWAKETIFEATQYGLIDSECALNWYRSFGAGDSFSYYTYDCTRGDFAMLAVNLLEVYYGKNIDDILEEKGVALGSFTDTDHTDILAANALGIVSGYEDGTYKPKGQIKRQEAAAILARTAKVMGLEDKTENITNFTDYSQIGTWAQESVAFCKATGVMQGTSATTFSPKGSYTREQCVATMVRLYEEAMRISK